MSWTSWSRSSSAISLPRRRRRRPPDKANGRAAARPFTASGSLRSRGDQVGDQLRRIGRPQSGYRVPPGACGPARLAAAAVVVDVRVVEVGCVFRGVVGDGIERGVDEPEVTSGDLVGDRDQAGPLWGTGARPANRVPAGAARTGSATSGAGGGGVPLCQVDENARPRAGLVGDVREAAHVAVRS